MAVRYVAPGGKDLPMSTSLWRYMSFGKLIYMLENKEIWLTRVDRLIEADPFEGSIPLRYGPPPDTEEQRAKDAAYEQRNHFAAGSAAQMRATRLATHRIERVRTYVSCWHAAQSDSDAMWRLYGAEKDGSVCVQTTTARAFEQLPNWLCIGKINYKSYETDVFPTNDSISPFFHKRTCFSHEKEVRFLANPLNSPIGTPWNQNSLGLPVSFDPNEFLIRICVSPASPEWFLPTVAATVRKLGVNVPVEPAPMSLKPIF